MFRKYVFRVLVLAAFLLLPLATQASPVTFFGGSNGNTTSIFLNVNFGGFNVNSDTTAITTLTIGFCSIPGVTFTEDSFVAIGVFFLQPSFFDSGPDFQFTSSGNQAGVTFTVTQTGAQDVTLGGVNYHLTYGLSQLTLLPGQTVNVTAP